MWICPKCEQTNQDSDSFCPLCGAAKTLKREAPVYGGAPVGEVRETPAPAPVKAAPTAVPGGAWGTVGDWRRDAKDKKEYEDAVAAASGPAAPQSAAAPQSVAAPKPAAAPPTPKADDDVDWDDWDDEKEERRIKAVKWLRAGIIVSSVLLFISMTFLSDAQGAWGAIEFIIIMLPAFLLAYKRSAQFRRIERWLGIFCNCFGIGIAVNSYVDVDATVGMGWMLAAVALCLLRGFMHKKALKYVEWLVKYE